MRDSSILLIVSAGMTIALISGGLDLSVAAVMAIAGVVMGWTYSQGVPMPVALLAGIATGPAIGALNGQLITRARINPLIATLKDIILPLFPNYPCEISTTSANAIVLPS